MRYALLILTFLFSRLAYGQQIIVPDDYNDEMDRLELKAHFPQGENAWLRFVEKNFDINAMLSGLPDSVHEIKDSLYVRFIVDKDGRITDPVNTPCSTPGFLQEVLRLLKKSPVWVPALQTVPVKSYVCYRFILNWTADYGWVLVMRTRTPKELQR